jgi:hypothetical protein
MSVDKPLPIVVALIALVLGASLAGLLLTKKRRGVTIETPELAPVG